MPVWLRRLLRVIAYVGACSVIVLAIAVGLFRLLLPRLPEYQDEIKQWASAAIGMQVEFSGMDARWGLSGPELRFYDAELLSPVDASLIIAAREVSIGVALTGLIVDRKLLVDRLVVSGSSLDVRQAQDGSWWLAGKAIDDLIHGQTRTAANVGGINLIGENIHLRIARPGLEQPLQIDIPDVRIRRDRVRVAVDADIQLPASLGSDAILSAMHLTRSPDSSQSWDVTLTMRQARLQGLSALLPEGIQKFASGSGDIRVALAYANGKVSAATTDFNVTNVSAIAGQAIDASGRVDFKQDPQGWLLAGDQLDIHTAHGSWPRTNVRVAASTAPDGQVLKIDAQAKYLNLDDISFIAPWLDEDRRAKLTAFSPSGVVRDLVATVSDLHTDKPHYNVSAMLIRVGAAADKRRPGIRGFSGELRADDIGGRLQIDSKDLAVELPRYLPQAIKFSDVDGTIVWRRSLNQTTILSDSIRVSNTFFSSSSNVQVTLNSEGASPVVDLASTLKVSDVSAAKKFIPTGIMKRKLYDWFQHALVSGEISNASLRFQGPLDKFPFDGGEGHLLIDATARKAVLRYLPEWPDVDLTQADIVVDNTRFYTKHNRLSTGGNAVVDAQVEIPDLRQPVLLIKAGTTGPLEAMRTFLVHSPIDALVGGELQHVASNGDANVDLDLTIPIREWTDFRLNTRIAGVGSRISVQGLPAAFTDMAGTLHIGYHDVSSESLAAQFLGRPLAVDLHWAADDQPQVSIIAKASGGATAMALIDELGVPLTPQQLSGTTDFVAVVNFPRRQNDMPGSLKVDIDSDLEGLQLDLPAPFKKSASDLRPTSGTIDLAPGGEAITTRGVQSGAMSWDLQFAKSDDFWDFDRGTLILGDGVAAPAEVRGLHIEGSEPEFRLEDWLKLPRDTTRPNSVLDRIRSVDVTIDDLYLLGQHLQAQHVRVDRSARDWLLQFDGTMVSASVFLPYDLQSGRPVVVDAKKLLLPGDDSTPTESSPSPDPRTLPPVTVKAAEFALGDRHVGAFKADFLRTARGLEADNIATSDPSFSIAGKGGWIVADTGEVESYLAAKIKSSNVKKTLDRLNYDPGIDGEDMSMTFDVHWPGAPRADFLDALSGDVDIHFGAGQLDEVEPGAGRMFGLMSIAALPRRLSLDFSDVFKKGFGFDKIDGKFQIERGTASTCNLHLEGPAADIGLIGTVGLGDGTYNQVAVINSNVGYTLPVVGAVVAGPEVAAALLIFSQIFKKPLRDIGQVYYSIEGNWTNPKMERSDAASFAKAGETADCLTKTK